MTFPPLYNVYVLFGVNNFTLPWLLCLVFYLLISNLFLTSPWSLDFTIDTHSSGILSIFSLSCCFQRLLTCQSQLVCVCVCACAQSCPSLRDPVDCSPPCSSVRGIFLVRMLEWVAISSSRESSWPRNKTCISCVSCTGRQKFFTTTPHGKQILKWSLLSLPSWVKLHLLNPMPPSLLVYFSLFWWNISPSNFPRKECLGGKLFEMLYNWKFKSLFLCIFTLTG